MHDTVVFLGPSCCVAEAADVLTADFRPAARAGDIRAAVRRGIRRVILIDGVMVYGYPPSPTEVYESIQAGVELIGAASLGALRAVELRNHGMQGVGWVYEQYLRTAVMADDELLALMHPVTQAPLTVPLIRVRYALECLGDEGRVPRPVAAQLLDELRTVYFEDRTRACIEAAASRAGMTTAATAELFDLRFDIKRADTLRCLSELRQCF